MSRHSVAHASHFSSSSEMSRAFVLYRRASERDEACVYGRLTWTSSNHGPATRTLSALRLEFRPIVLHLHPELCIPVFFLSVLPSFLGPHIVLLVAICLEIEAAAAVVGKERDKEGARGVCSCHWNVRHKYDRGHRLAGRRGSGSEQLTDNWSRPPCRA